MFESFARLAVNFLVLLFLVGVAVFESLGRWAVNFLILVFLAGLGLILLAGLIFLKLRRWV
jgi:hypothetical protein